MTKEGQAPTSFADAVQVKAASSHTYTFNFAHDWRIGTVPNGGYVTSVLLSAVEEHFRTTLKAQNQPHSMSVQLQFMRRTEMGPGRVTIKDVKLGRQATVVHVSLDQDGREEVVGYIAQSNIAEEKGPSFKTGWQLQPPSKPVDFAKLAANNDPGWMLCEHLPWESFRPATLRLQFYVPKGRFHSNSVLDQWIRFSSGEKFTQRSLGFVVDMFPLIVENYHGNSPQEFAEGGFKDKTRNEAKFWYPTILLNMDVKKALPEEGVEWLFLRVVSRQIKNGRLDYDIVVLDQGGEIVCTSQHANFIVDVSRNFSQRRKEGSDPKL